MKLFKNNFNDVYFKKNNYEINIARGTKAICLPQTCSLFHFKRQMWFTFNI